MSITETVDATLSTQVVQEINEFAEQLNLATEAGGEPAKPAKKPAAKKRTPKKTPAVPETKVKVAPKEAAVEVVKAEAQKAPSKPPQYIPMIPQSKLVVKIAYSIVKDGKQFHRLAQTELGLTMNDCKSFDSRVVRVDINKGIINPAQNDKKAFRDLTLEDPIVSYTLFETEDGRSRFLAIGCTGKTVYMIMRKDLSYSFVIDVSSLNPLEAVTNLYVSNLNKGQASFTKTAGLLGNFFENLFSAVLDDRTILAFDVTRFSGTVADVRLYVNPKDHTEDMISVNNYVFDVELNKFPGRQIARGDTKPKKAASQG